jgi:hypothetical protein
MIVGSYKIIQRSPMASRGRPKQDEPGRKVEPTIPAGMYRRLEQLSEMDEYPATPTEVAKYLIMRAIDDLKRAGVFDRIEATRSDSTT